MPSKFIDPTQTVKRQEALKLLRQYKIDTLHPDDKKAKAVIDRQTDPKTARAIAQAYQELRRIPHYDGKQPADLSKNVPAPPNETTNAPYKAWVNVLNGEVLPFAFNTTHETYMKENQVDFGNIHAKTFLQYRIKAEEMGWCAVGVNVAQGFTLAVVFAISPENALAAARMLLKLRYRAAKWKALKVVTNSGTKSYQGLHEIGAYLQTEQSSPTSGMFFKDED